MAGRDTAKPAGALRPVTMRDIARAVGVSQSTVSRVLSGANSSVPIAAATRQRILDEAARRHFRPNPLASGLSGARTMLLGIIVREITGPFLAEVVQAATREAATRGYGVVLGHALSYSGGEVAPRSSLETRHADAILLLGDASDQPGVPEELVHAGVPIFGMWQGEAPVGIPSINVDNHAAIRSVVDHLYELGHRNIAFLAGQLTSDTRLRRAACRTRMTELGLPDMLVQSGGDDWDVSNYPAGQAEFEALMHLSPRPTAVVAATDVLAFGALRGAHFLGLRVPEDVSIVGFDDIPVAAYTIPSLTTVHQPVAEMVAIAVREALDGARGTPPKRYELEAELVVRESTGPAPTRERD